MLCVSVPAVVIRKYSGCILASPEPFVITSNNFLLGCVCSSLSDIMFYIPPDTKYVNNKKNFVLMDEVFLLKKSKGE